MRCRRRSTHDRDGRRSHSRHLLVQRLRSDLADVPRHGPAEWRALASRTGSHRGRPMMAADLLTWAYGGGVRLPGQVRMTTQRRQFSSVEHIRRAATRSLSLRFAGIRTDSAPQIYFSPPISAHLSGSNRAVRTTASNRKEPIMGRFTRNTPEDESEPV